MASTYSPNLRIELIATGEQSNTWGGTTNNNLGTLIEQAISGVVSIDVSAGNVTLTALQGAEDQSRQMVIIATGTAGVTRTITAPAVNKVYSVVNNSNTTVSFIASGGTGVTLIAGAKKYVYCDGTNFYDAINAVTVTSGTIDGTTIGATTPTTGKFTTVQSTVATGTAPFTVASTTPVANLTASNVTTNANLTGAVTSVGNATSLGSFTSAQLATALTDETGSGSAVFATSPTLVTPNLGTPSTLVGTNITGTAAGLTAGTVTTNANLTGAITSGGNATSLGSFTSAQLALAISDETGTGKAVFSVNPSITSATLVTPILGTPQSGDLTNCTFPTLNQSTTGNAATATTLIGNQTNWASYRSSAVANMLGWKNFGSGHVIFDASQSTSPTGSSVNNTTPSIAWASSYPTLMGWNGTDTYGVRTYISNISETCTGNAATVTNGVYNNGGTYGINISGNAATVTNGVYNTGGTYNINVTGSSASCTGNAATVSNGVYNNGGTYSINVTGNAASASTATNQSGGSVNATTITGSSDATINGLTVGRGPGNRVTNTTVGNGALYSNTVGDYNTAVGNGALYSSPAGAYNTAVGYGANSANGNGLYNTTIGYDTQTSTTGSSNEIVIGAGAQGFGAYYVTIGNGTNYIYNKYNTNATWTRVSDERLKTNIQPADIGLSFINRLNVKTYNWRPSYDIPKELNAYSEENTQDTDTVMYGMLAQDVKAALDAENVEHFAGWDVSPKDGTQAVSMEMFVLPLINAIKELTARLEALESK